MRKRILGTLAALAFVSVAAVWGGNDARADGGPHVAGAGMTADGCAGCHRAHTAQAPYLLKVDEVSLCYTCHDGTQASTNVLGGISTAAAGGTAGGALKAGGFLYAALDTDDPSHKSAAGEPVTVAAVGVLAPANQPVTSAHSVDGSAQTAWGSGPLGVGGTSPASASVNLTCAACHDPHGNGNYRILRSVPVAPLAGGTTDLAVTYGGGVTIPDPVVKVPYTTTNYWDITYIPATMGVSTKGIAAPIVAPGTDATEVGISAWCSQCHQWYLARPGSWEVDSGDSTFKYRHATEGQSSSGSARPQCITCHVSHGTNAVVTAGGPADSATNYATGVVSTSLLKMDNRGVCQKCHNK